MEDITVPVDSTGTAVFSDIEICEGSYLTQTFAVNSRTPNQRYVLPNAGIDTDTINVIVRETQQSSVKRKFIQYDSLIGVGKDTPLYFLRETEGERYELLFGDGVFGVPVEEPNFIEVILPFM